MSAEIWIVNLVILGAVLQADLGRQRVWWWRIVRPLVATAIVVPLFLQSPQGAGNGLLFELTVAGGGLVFGLIISLGLMKVGRDQNTGQLTSWAGFPYAVAWVLVIGARLIFSYGADNWFTQDLGRWLQTSHITKDGLTDGLILMAIVMTLTRTGRLAVALVANDKVMTASPPQTEIERPVLVGTTTSGSRMSRGPIHQLLGRTGSSESLLSRGPIHRLVAARRLGPGPSVYRDDSPRAPGS
jgi:hypothetical protein